MCISMAPISVLRRRISSRAICGVTPLRSRELVVGRPSTRGSADRCWDRPGRSRASRLQPQAEALDARLDDIAAADQHRARDAFVHHLLRGPQHALVLALGIDHALGRVLRRREHRLHDQAGLVDELVQALAVGVEIGRSGASPRRSPSRRCATAGAILRDQARIEGPRDEVLGPEGEMLLAVGRGDDVGLLGLRQLGDRLHRRELHLARDGGRADVERAAEDERESTARC